MGKSIYEAAKEFYRPAIQTDRAQRLLAARRRYPGYCVLNFDVEEAGRFQIIYKDGQLIFEEGHGEVGPDGKKIDIEVAEVDLRDVLEARMDFTSAVVERKLHMPDYPLWDFSRRPYICLLGAITKAGQELVLADKAKRFELLS